MRRPTASDARAALWTARAIVGVRRSIRRTSIDRVGVLPPPPLPDDAVAAVGAVLHFGRQKCLVRALVLQRWHAAHGRPHELVIGITAPSTGFRAHAWLADDGADPSQEFTELLRSPAPTGG